jgi:predicted  nucleic acid-binding Zn-ribbon protein
VSDLKGIGWHQSYGRVANDAAAALIALSMELAQEREGAKQKEEAANKYWILLCDTAEALGLIFPETCPYLPEHAKKVMKRFEADYETLQSKLAEALNDRETARQARNTIEADYDALEDQRDALAAKLAEVELERDAEARKASALSDSYSKTVGELNAALSRIESLEKELDEYGRMVDQAQNERDEYGLNSEKANEIVNLYSEEVASLKLQLAQIKSDERDLRVAITDCSAQLLQANKKIDYPDADGTDYAHPAWWRGHDHAIAMFCHHVNQILDGKDDGTGENVEGNWRDLRKRLLAMRKELSVLGPVQRQQRSNMGVWIDESEHHEMRVDWQEQYPGHRKIRSFRVVNE